MKQIYRHPRLGLVTVSKTRAARRISVSVRPPADIRLTIPARVSLKVGMAFLESREQWIEETVTKLAGKYPRQVLESGFTTRRHSLEFESHSGIEVISWSIKNGIITVVHPDTLSADSSPVQKTARKAIEEAWRIEAKMYLPERVAQIASATGLRCGKITVRNTVSKWGSCSYRNDLSLSLHLMKLPEHLIDYVILHELCHTVHKNHGEQFHDLLGKLTDGNHQKWRKELLGYNTRW